MTKEHVILTPADESYLRERISKGSLAAKIFKRATALLELHQGKTFLAVAKTLDVASVTIATWAHKYKTAQLTFLQDAPRTGRPVVISGESRAKLTALACSQAPDGRSQWSLRLLAAKAVELEYCPQLSHNQTRVILKKTSLNPTSNVNGVLVK